MTQAVNATMGIMKSILPGGHLVAAKHVTGPYGHVAHHRKRKPESTTETAEA